MNAVDLFAGIGGWDLAARELGVDPLGFELDEWACQTRDAAGLSTLRTDIAKYNLASYDACELLIASPPCQGFSVAGKRDPNDPRNALVWEPKRWIQSQKPRAIAMEQVPPVLPIWEEYCAWLRTLGYSAWCGILNAEQYGVPQTRRRAILMASLDRKVGPPPPTHSRYYSRDPKRLDEGVLPWVSMAEALGWGYDGRPSPVVTGGGAATGGAEPFGNSARKALQQWTRETKTLRSAQSVAGGPRAKRDASEPSVTVGTNFDRAKWTPRSGLFSDERPASYRDADRPAAAVHSKTDRQVWVPRDAVASIPSNKQVPKEVREGWGPAPTIVARGDGKGGPNPMGGTGAKAAWAARGADGVRITLAEALVLQGFPPDYPVQGKKTRQFLQVGNAICPPLAHAILKRLIG